MLRSIISEKVTTEKHYCDCEALLVEKQDNYRAYETIIYCKGIFRMPLGDKKYVDDVEKLLQNIIYNLDDKIKDIYKR